jgi:hypothetical protein
MRRARGPSHRLRGARPAHAGVPGRPPTSSIPSTAPRGSIGRRRLSRWSGVGGTTSARLLSKQSTRRSPGHPRGGRLARRRFDPGANGARVVRRHREARRPRGLVPGTTAAPEFPADAGAYFHTHPSSPCLEEVQANFARFGLLDEQVSPWRAGSGSPCLGSSGNASGVPARRRHLRIEASFRNAACTTEYRLEVG